ncbi:MAG: SDR family NAD(P)-dependent oxidoreductase [Steroidobacteraceae bacterium]
MGLDEHGAVGCLIYSDPRDDGYFEGNTYPSGGWRPPEGVQRGSVMNIALYPGDPTTPGYGSVPGAKHLPIQDAATLQKIPVLPISCTDAMPLLRALGGPVAPSGWRAALPITYHIGAGPAKMHLRVKSDWSLEPIYDVIAVLKGSTDRNQWVIRGNHHDGWVFGAWDPLAVTVALMGEAKALGARLEPRRGVRRRDRESAGRLSPATRPDHGIAQHHRTVPTAERGPPMRIDLGNTGVLVTGASRGIGAAVARAMGKAGARVAIHYRSERPLTEPEDIAAFVVFLASGRGDHSTGCTIEVNAGSYVH